MKRHFSIVLFSFVMGSILLAACSGGFAATSWPGVTLQGDVVYVAYGGSVFAVGLKDGSLIWQFPEKPDAQKGFYAAPAVLDGQVIVGDYVNVLHSLDANTGAEQWTFTQAKGRWVGSALVVGERIFAPSSDHNLYVLNQQGKLIWAFKARQALWAQPVVKDNVVYLPSMDHSLYALSVEDGRQLWATDVGGAIVYSPALDGDNKVYVGTLANELVALDAQSGKILWRFAAKNSIWGSPTVDDGSVYIGDLSGTIFSISASDGSSQWQVDAGGPVTAAGAVTPQGLVFGTENGNILMLSRNGQKVWTQTVEGKIYSSPAVADDRMVFGVMAGEKLLVAFDFSGNPLWSFAVPK